MIVVVDDHLVREATTDIIDLVLAAGELVGVAIADEWARDPADSDFHVRVSPDPVASMIHIRPTIQVRVGTRSQLEEVMTPMIAADGAINQDMWRRSKSDESHIDNVATFLRWLLARLDSPTRLHHIGSTAAAEAVGQLEPVLGALTELGHQGRLDEDTERYVSSIIRSLNEFRFRDDANPLIWELYVADLVRRLEDYVLETARIRKVLTDCGADEALASEIVDAIVDTLRRAMAPLEDPRADGDRLALMASNEDRIAAALERLADNSETFRQRIAKAGAKGVGSAAVRWLRDAIDDPLVKAQIGLSMIWKAIRALFT